MTNACPHPECKLQKPREMYACKAHWYSLPRSIRTKILDGYRIGPLSADWQAADEEAMQHWRRQLGLR